MLIGKQVEMRPRQVGRDHARLRAISGRRHDSFLLVWQFTALREPFRTYRQVPGLLMEVVRAIRATHRRMATMESANRMAFRNLSVGGRSGYAIATTAEAVLQVRITRHLPVVVTLRTKDVARATRSNIAGQRRQGR